jgi:hypothetical protein
VWTDRIELGENAGLTACNCTLADYSGCLSSGVWADRAELGGNAGFNCNLLIIVSVYLVVCGQKGQEGGLGWNAGFNCTLADYKFISV